MKAVIYGRLQGSLLDKAFHFSPPESLPALHIWRRLVTKVVTIIRTDVERKYRVFITLFETFFQSFYVTDSCVMTRFLSGGLSHVCS